MLIWTKKIMYDCIENFAYAPVTRFFNSATILVSISKANNFFAFSKILTDKFPVPGPTSMTTSVGFTFAFSIIEFTIAGFFKMCCPWPVLKLRPKRGNLYGLNQ